MDEQSYIFHFAFTPNKLSAVRKKVEEKYRDVDMLTASQISYLRLPKILEMIRNTSEDRLELLAAEFNRRDFSVLTYSYPYSKESSEVQKKINMVLASGYTPGNANMIWEKFQREYKHIYTQDLLRRFLLKDEDVSFIYSDYSEADLKEMLLPAFMHKSGIAQGLLQVMIDKDPKISEFLKTVKIKPETHLEDFLVYERLNEGLRSDSFIDKNSVSYITQVLEKYTVEQYQRLLKVYLENKNYEQFHVPILDQAIKRLHDPREHEAGWLFLGEEILAEVKRWLLQNELAIFFENDNNRRFEYWKKHLHYIYDVKQLSPPKDPSVAFIYFKEFVVVEFGEMGAAYFYHKKGFNQFILSKTTGTEFQKRSIRAKESMLKMKDFTVYRGEKLYINALGHNGNYDTWTDKFTRHLHEYMDGNYNYSGW